MRLADVKFETITGNQIQKQQLETIFRHKQYLGTLVIINSYKQQLGIKTVTNSQKDQLQQSETTVRTIMRNNRLIQQLETTV